MNSSGYWGRGGGLEFWGRMGGGEEGEPAGWLESGRSIWSKMIRDGVAKGPMAF